MIAKDFYVLPLRRPEHSEVVPLWYGRVAEQVIKAATLSPTASVLSLKGKTKEKAYAVLPLEQRKGSLLVPLERRDKRERPRGRCLRFAA